MKTTLFRFLGFLALLVVTTISAHAKCSCPKPPKFVECDKVYVQPSQIDLIDGQILVKVEEQVLQTSMILTDEQGFYFKDYKKQGDCPDFQWECEVCHACNDNWNNYCQICWN